MCALVRHKVPALPRRISRAVLLLCIRISLAVPQVQRCYIAQPLAESLKKGEMGISSAELQAAAP